MKNEKVNLREEVVTIPICVPQDEKETYASNYKKATHGTGNLFLFAGDQKIEHMNKDFYGKNIPPECATPQHLFEIAREARIGVFATQLGLISKYGNEYHSINYIVKLNSRTNLVPTKQKEPISLLLNTVDDVVRFQKGSKLSVVGVGYTVYLGSENESKMLQEAARVVFDAHQNGLLAVLWMYPRGKAVKNEKDADLIAGAAGVGACLGADFVKVNPPDAKNGTQSARFLKQAVLAAGETRVICSGGSLKDEYNFLDELYQQIYVGGAGGCAVGRNIHQKKLADAINFCDAIAAIVIDGYDFEKAKKFIE